MNWYVIICFLCYIINNNIIYNKYDNKLKYFKKVLFKILKGYYILYIYDVF